MRQQSDWNTTSRKQWDKNASSWDERSVQMWENGSRKDIIPFFKKYLPTGSRIADIGCGSGYSTFKLRNEGYDVIGTDISVEMINIAKEKLGNKVPFFQADICNLTPIKNNELDGALVINVIEWTEVPIIALRELKRSIKRDGLLCIGILGPTAGPRTYSYRRVYGENVIMNTMMPWEFLQMAQENGWELVDDLGVNKKGVNELQIKALSFTLKQALSFMWVFMLKNV